jgi:hypothetical protein
MSNERQYDLVAVIGDERFTWQYIGEEPPEEIFKILVALENEFDGEIFVRLDGEFINLNDEVPARGGDPFGIGMFTRKHLRSRNLSKPPTAAGSSLRRQVTMHLYPLGVE